MTPGGGGGAEEESRAELRVRLAEAERLVRRLRADAERQRREVLGGAGVTNLLFDGAAARHAHVRYPRALTLPTSLLRSCFALALLAGQLEAVMKQKPQ